MEIGDDDILKYEETLENYTNFTEESVETSDGSQEINKSKNLQQKLLENIFGADLTLCIFMAALKSYRADRCLRPFPPMFISKDEKDFHKLKNVCDIIPPIKTIVNSKKYLSDDIVNLLSWLFIQKGFPLLKQRSLNTVPFKLKSSSLEPQYIFEVCYPSSVEDVFLNRTGNKDIFYAYHGSAIDNFYSILKVGLQQHFSVGKEVLFGNGVYLSSEISVCTQYAPFGETWRNSSLGYKHSIIAVCEVINDIDKVKCKDAKHKERSHNNQSYGEIPEKYFVVTDSDMLRVKYLLVYSCKKKTSVKSFVTNNLFYIILLLYFLMLVIIGFLKSPTWSKFLRWFKK